MSIFGSVFQDGALACPEGYAVSVMRKGHEDEKLKPAAPRPAPPGYTFAVPKSGYENDALKAVVRSRRGASSAWIRLSEPSFEGLWTSEL